MTNDGVRSYRLWINLAKVVLVAAAFAAFVFLLKQPVHGKSLVHLVSLVILGVTTCVALIDVFLESFDVPRLIVIWLSFLAIIFIALNVLELYRHGVWEQESFGKWVTLSLAFVLFFFLHIVLAYSDMEMDIDNSNIYHPSGRRREAKFFRHMAFNVLPYLIGFGGIYFITRVYGESTAIKFGIGAVIVLLLFAILDEALRCRLRWSFFWRNDPEHRRS